MNNPASLGYAAVRRIVTGHNEQGESIITSDSNALNVVADPGKPIAQVLWATGEGRAQGDEPAPAGHKFAFHSEGGSLLRIVDFPPDDSYDEKKLLDMTTREIVDTFKEMYDADISPTLISKVTEAVIGQVVEWQSRPLDPVYPVVYLDCIVVKIRQDKQVINKAIYLALGVNLEGHKELLGMWLSENEGAKFWLGQLNIWLLRYYSETTLMVLGLCLYLVTTAGFFLSAVFDVATLTSTILLLLGAIGSLSLSMGNMTSLAMACVPERAGSASAIFGVTQYMFSGIAGVLTGILFDGSLVPVAGAMAVTGVGALLFLLPAKKLSAVPAIPE